MHHRHSLLLTCGDPTVRADDPEPALRDLLDDPVLKSVMRSDHVSRGDLLGLVAAARAHLMADRLVAAE
jgi:hypothetical protein